MKLNSSLILFLITLTVSIFISISSNNWLMIWCGLEMSLVSFIPIMSLNTVISSESSIKYFITQGISSSILILGIMFMMFKLVNSNLLILISLMIKMGIVPFHSWILLIIEGLNFNSILLLLIFLKISPTTLVSYFNFNLSFIIMLNLMFSSILGLNQSSTRKILSYSSIFNMGLIMVLINFNFMWVFYLFIYFILMSSLIFTLNYFNMNYINQIVLNNTNFIYSLNLWFMLLSMGGMPPMLGFLLKLICIEFLIFQSKFLVCFFLIIFSLLLMFFYMRLTYVSMLFFNTIFKTYMFKVNNYSSFIMSLNFLGLMVFLYLKMFV